MANKIGPLRRGRWRKRFPLHMGKIDADPLEYLSICQDTATATATCFALPLVFNEATAMLYLFDGVTNALLQVDEI